MSGGGTPYPRTAGVWSQDLRANNPLRERTMPITGRFETERCPYHAIAMRDQSKTEHQRRWDAIVRREKHIVQPPALSMSARIDDHARMASPRPAPVLRPSLSLGYSSDRLAFQLAQQRVHDRAMRRPEKLPEKLRKVEPEPMRGAFSRTATKSPKHTRRKSRQRSR